MGLAYVPHMLRWSEPRSLVLTRDDPYSNKCEGGPVQLHFLGERSLKRLPEMKLPRLEVMRLAERGLTMTGSI